MLMRIGAVKDETGERSNATVYANIREGLFTKPVQIGKRSVGWPDYEVKAICVARIAGKSIAEIKALVIDLHRRRTKLFDEFLSAVPDASAMSDPPIHERHAVRPNVGATTRTLRTKTGGAV